MGVYRIWAGTLWTSAHTLTNVGEEMQTHTPLSDDPATPQKLHCLFRSFYCGCAPLFNVTWQEESLFASEIKARPLFYPLGASPCFVLVFLLTVKLFAFACFLNLFFSSCLLHPACPASPLLRLHPPKQPAPLPIKPVTQMWVTMVKDVKRGIKHGVLQYWSLEVQTKEEKQESDFWKNTTVTELNPVSTILLIGSLAAFAALLKRLEKCLSWHHDMRMETFVGSPWTWPQTHGPFQKV